MGSTISKIPETKVETSADRIISARAEFTRFWIDSVDAGQWRDSGCQMSACQHRCEEIADTVSRIVNQPEYTGEWKGMSFEPIYYRLEIEARKAYKARRIAYLNSLSAEKVAIVCLPEWRFNMKMIALDAARKADHLRWVASLA